MSRLFWVAVGAAATVAGARRLGVLPQAAAGGPAASTLQAVRTASGALHHVGDARREFLAGMAEREAQLRHDLVGDVDVDALRAARDERRSADRDAPVRPSGVEPPAWHRDPADREAARAARARRGWAGGPTDDPADGDGDLPYSFY